jgi:hypothetical protein
MPRATAAIDSDRLPIYGAGTSGLQVFSELGVGSGADSKAVRKVGRRTQTLGPESGRVQALDFRAHFGNQRSPRLGRTLLGNDRFITAVTLLGQRRAISCRL